MQYAVCKKIESIKNRYTILHIAQMQVYVHTVCMLHRLVIHVCTTLYHVHIQYICVYTLFGRCFSVSRAGWSCLRLSAALKLLKEAERSQQTPDVLSFLATLLQQDVQRPIEMGSLRKTDNVWTFHLDSSYWLLHSCAICLEAFLCCCPSFPQALVPAIGSSGDTAFASKIWIFWAPKKKIIWNMSWIKNGGLRDWVEFFFLQIKPGSSRSIILNKTSSGIKQIYSRTASYFEFFGNKPSRQLRSLAAAWEQAEEGYHGLHNMRWTSWNQRLTLDNFANLCLLFALLDVFCISLYLMSAQRSFLCSVRSDSHSIMSFCQSVAMVWQ